LNSEDVGLKSFFFFFLPEMDFVKILLSIEHRQHSPIGEKRLYPPGAEV